MGSTVEEVARNRKAAEERANATNNGDEGDEDDDMLEYNKYQIGGDNERFYVQYDPMEAIKVPGGAPKSAIFDGVTYKEVQENVSFLSTLPTSRKDGMRNIVM